MEAGSSRWNEITPSPHPHERAALEHVRDLLPDRHPYQAWSNFTFTSDQGHVREVDLLVAASTGFYLVEIKNFRGRLTNQNATWVLQGDHSRRTFDNPLPLADQKAKELKGLLARAATKDRGVRPPFIRAVIFLAEPGMTCALDADQRHGLFGPQGGNQLVSIGDGLLLAPVTHTPPQPEFLRALPRLLQRVGIHRTQRSITVGPWRIDPRPYDQGPTWQDHDASREDVDAAYRRIRIYLYERTVRTAAQVSSPVVAPPSPRHIVAQQLLALALQQHTLGVRTWPEWWGGLAPMASDGHAVLAHLVEAGYLETDGDLAFVGPEAERRFGHRHFSDLTSVFTAAPEFTVLAGREEIGTVGDDVLVSDSGDAPRVLLLAGRAWLVGYVDWKRRRCFVEPTDLPGRARWTSAGAGLSFEITRGIRDVLLGIDSAEVTLSRRAAGALSELREHHSGQVSDGRTVIERSATGDVHWWTWAGTAANRTLHASLPHLVDPRQRVGDRGLRMRAHLDTRDLTAALETVDAAAAVPVNDAALTGLKFSAAVPDDLARRTLATRLADPDGARRALNERRIVLHSS